MARFIGSLDQGTTSTRFILFTREGKIHSSCQKEHAQICPKQGLTEHDPNEIWSNSVEVIRGALERGNAKASDVAAVGITNQRETTIVWSKSTGKPLCNAIVWMDMRSSDICSSLAEKLGGKDALQPKTGLPIVPYFSGTKCRWILDNVLRREAAEVAMQFLELWIRGCSGGSRRPRWRQTYHRRHERSRTLLMNLETLSWDEDLCSAIGVPMKMLPEIRSLQESFSCALPELKGVPVSGVLGDQQAALFGQSCFSVGEAKNTYGTGCFLLLNTGPRAVQSKYGLLSTVAYKIGDAPAVYALEGSVAIGGALIQWLRDNLQIIDDAAEVESLAKQVTDNGGVYFVPAFAGLYAPYWRDDARGVIAGLTRFASKAHIARAALEATAYQSRDVFEAMQKDAGVDLSVLKVDGGLAVNDRLMQFPAAVLGSSVVRPAVTETTALGAAYAAGLAVGVWNSLEELREQWSFDKTWKSSMTDDERLKLLAGWRKGIDRTLNWVDK